MLEEMKRTMSIRRAGLSVLAAFVMNAVHAQPPPAAIRFTGTADASAAERLGQDLIVVASDEDNVLRVYRVPQGGAPVASWDLSPRMALAPHSPEMDIEGSARIGDVCYWITSHAPNKEGKPRPNRKRFFAVRITLKDNAPVFELIGKPVATLLADLARDPRYAPLRLEEAALRPPKTPGSLNIEALCDTPEGGLLIGFRSPNPGGKALLAPLLNPAETVQGLKPRFGDPILLDFEGNGFRSLFRRGSVYYAMSGSALRGGEFRLYRWDGRGAPRRAPLAGLPADASPEGLTTVVRDGQEMLLAISDDGTRLIDGVSAKTLADPARRTFRGFLFPLPE